jgi:hypothetical protein
MFLPGAATLARSKTRPSAQYDANGLASPDIKLACAIRLIVACTGILQGNVIHLTTARKSSSGCCDDVTGGGTNQARPMAISSSVRAFAIGGF